ncbi:helix-turn-helix domain-containing protein [Streptomyces sp. NPDC088762]|uniref:helix-turn-helix domain-containing protein n=1 Tax=Streptomyces sp. NPDC088762 TaxID=3365891 RepID=UPI0037FB0748
MKKMAYGHKTPHQARQRATIVLLAARGCPNSRIAAQTGMHVDTVRTWRSRFAGGGLPALSDRRRSGRPPSFTPLQVAEVKALACQLPAETGTPLSRWSCPELAREVVARAIAPAMSASTVRRWLKADAIKPWQYRSWIFIRDPDFRIGPGRPRVRPDRVIGDKGYTSKAIRAWLRCRGIAHTIPERSDQVRNRARRGSPGGRPPAFDKQVYKRRNLVERCFNRLNQWRGIATRYDKTAQSYRAAGTLASLLMWA